MVVVPSPAVLIDRRKQVVPAVLALEPGPRPYNERDLIPARYSREFTHELVRHAIASLETHDFEKAS